MKPIYYGLGELGPSAIDVFIKVYLLVYFDKFVGLPVTFASSAIALSVVWDACIDPFIGKWVDQYYRQYQTRKPLLYVGMGLFFISFLMVWKIPYSENHFLTAFLLFCISAILNSSLALFQIPYVAVANDLVKDDVKRKTWIGWRVAFLNFGLIFGMTIPTIFMSSKEAMQNEYILSTYAIGIVALVFTCASVFLTYFKNPAGSKAESSSNVVSLTLKQIIFDQHFLKLLMAFFVVFLGIGLNNTLAIYYYTSFLGFDDRQFQLILISFMFVFILSVPFWIWLTRFFSQQKLITLGGFLLGLMTAGSFPFFKDLPFLFVLFIASGVGGVLVGSAVILETYLSDYLSEKERELKQSVSGQYLGIWKMAQKMSRGIAIGLAGPILNSAEGKPQLLGYYFGFGVGALFLLSAIVMLWPTEKTRQES